MHLGVGSQLSRQSSQAPRQVPGNLRERSKDQQARQPAPMVDAGVSGRGQCGIFALAGCSGTQLPCSFASAKRCRPPRNDVPVQGLRNFSLCRASSSFHRHQRERGQPGSLNADSISGKVAATFLSLYRKCRGAKKLRRRQLTCKT